MNRLSFIAVSIAASMMLTGCSDDCDHPMFSGTDANITSLTISTPEMSTSAIIRGDSLIVIKDYFDESLATATATMTLSEGATVSPAPESVSDWSHPIEFTVTSVTGIQRKIYHYVVLQDNVTLTTQAEVNRFGADRPVWAGNIVIRDTDDDPIVDLTPLASLRSIAHNLTIASYHGKEISFPNLVSAHNLTIDGANIKRISMPALKTVNNLSIGRSARPSGNGISLSFPELNTVGSDLIIRLSTDRDYKFSGFENLQTIAGELTFVAHTLDLGGFRSLKSVGNLAFGNCRIESLSGLENLETIEGTLSTYYTTGFKTGAGLHPTKIGAVELEGLQVLQDLKFLENVESLTYFWIHGGYSLKSLKGVEKLRRIETNLMIGYTGISSLEEFANLEYIGKKVDIYYNPRLADFSALKKALQNFDGEWKIQGNAQNPSIEDILNN